MLTGTQHKALAYIRNYISEYGYSPTFSEIASGLGIKSRGVVHRYVHALEDAGYIELVQGRKRNIQLKLENAKEKIPFLGQIAAGKPLEAIEDKQSIHIAEELAGENRYALKVKGDSMVDAGILDGDIVIIDKFKIARNGDIVVALIDNDEATLKTFKKIENSQVELIPRNTTMQTMIFHQSKVTIQGVLVGQFRTY